MSTDPQTRRFLAFALALLLVMGGLAGCGINTTKRAKPTPCSGSPVTAIQTPQSNVEDLGLDVSVSTQSRALRAAYQAAALALVNQAANEKAAIKIVAFGASGVGAKVVFEGSFAPASDDDVYNLAVQNRLSCWAKYAIRKALATRTPPRDGGSDVAGTLASLIADARSLEAPRGSASVTVFTDGCQAPSPSGPNRNLTDLCGLLASGESPAKILKAHASEFSVGDASGIATSVKGIGIGRDENAANSVFARKLTAFWYAACRRARARACQIGSAVS
jgi:hypothetical protein